MQRFLLIFLCLALSSAFQIPLRSKTFSKIGELKEGVQLRSGNDGYGNDGYNGYDDTSYDRSEDESSTSESSESESESNSKSCEQPEPREECPAAQPNWAPLFVGHGVVAWSGELMKVQNPKAICDCDTSSKLYYADVLEVHPNYLKQVETYNKLTYTLNNKQGCPQMCIRTTDGKFWDATGLDPVVVLIATYCEGSICYNYAGLKSGTLKHGASEFKPTTTNNNQKTMGESSDYLKVDAISCQGCAKIADEVTEQCYAIP